MRGSVVKEIREQDRRSKSLVFSIVKRRGRDKLTFRQTITWKIVIPTTFTMYAAMASRQLKPKAGKNAMIIGGSMPWESRCLLRN
jgi:hypothetical protein